MSKPVRRPTSLSPNQDIAAPQGEEKQQQERKKKEQKNEREKIFLKKKKQDISITCLNFRKTHFGVIYSLERIVKKSITHTPIQVPQQGPAYRLEKISLQLLYPRFTRCSTYCILLCITHPFVPKALREK